MSYILDALKKSEQERGHGNVPGVQTVHTSSLSYKDKKAYWPYILITAVVLNLVVMLYFILGNDVSEDKALVDGRDTETLTTDDPAMKRTKPTTGTAIVDQIPINTPAQVYTDRDTSSGQSGPQITGSKDDAAEIETNLYTIEELSRPVLPKEDSPMPTEQSEIISYHELDESIKQQLPAIIVSAHVYSSNPQQRSIVINNNFLEEGEYIIDDLILHEITPNGAILNYNGILFRSDVVSGWQ